MAYFLSVAILFLLGCAGPAPKPGKEEGMALPKPPEVPRVSLYLALIWDGEVTRLGEANPEMITNLLALLEKYPQIHITCNLSPEMAEQMNPETIDILRRLQELGRIQVAPVPPGRPVLPLLYDTDLASAMGAVTMLPKEKWKYPEDVRARVMSSVNFYRNYFGSFPSGMWPPEGAVASEVLDVVSDCRVEWVASGEEVLGNSLNIRFARNEQGQLLNPEFLYRPYLVSRGKRAITIVFRDRILSDRINLVYPSMDPNEAARDFIERLLFIQKEWKQEIPPLVTVVMDNGGSMPFLTQFFNRLANISSIKAIGIQEYLKGHPAVERIERLTPGSLVNGNFDSWIGEEEENVAWELLGEARLALENYKNSGRAKIEQLDQAFTIILKASDSKWFWWYGQDQNSGRDEIFDQEYRSLLIKVYQTIGMEPPARLFQPIVAYKELLPERGILDFVTPQIDGMVDKGEWDNAGYYVDKKSKIFDKIYYGYDRFNLYLRLDAKELLAERRGTDFFIGFYMGTPGAGKYNLSTRYGGSSGERVLGFGLSHEVGIWLEQLGSGTEDGKGKAVLSGATGENTWQPILDLYSMAVGAYSFEIAIPFEYLNISGGEKLRMIAVAAGGGVELEVMPPFVPITVIIPELFNKAAGISRIVDPVGDDYGPGNYTYPMDPVFKPGSFDIREFSVSEGTEYLLFKVKLGIIENPWASPSGLSLQIIDLYVDLNNKVGAGSMELLPGRNAYTTAEDAWEYAISVDGWQQVLYKIDGAGKPAKLANLKMKVDSASGEVTIYVPRSLLRGDPRNWGYLPIVLAFDGESASRNWNVREIREVNDESHFGGASAFSDKGIVNIPNIIDAVLPRGQNQRNILGVYRQGRAVEIPATRFK